MASTGLGHINVDSWEVVKASSLREAYLYPSIRSFLQTEAPGKRVLDIGCGSGNWCKAAVQYGATRVDGFDIQEDMVEQAKKANSSEGDKMHIRVGDQYDNRYEDNSFDVAISIFTICYSSTVDELVKFYKELYRVLSPGGKAIISNLTDTYPQNSLWFQLGTDKVAARQKVKTIMDSLPLNPTKEQINDAIETGNCSEVLFLVAAMDKSGRVHLADEMAEVGDGEPLWIKFSKYTFRNIFYTSKTMTDTIKAAGLNLDQIEQLNTEERRLAHNRANPMLKHGEEFSKYQSSVMYHVSKPF